MARRHPGQGVPEDMKTLAEEIDETLRHPMTTDPTNETLTAPAVGSVDGSTDAEVRLHCESMAKRRSILDAIRPKDYSDEFYTPDPIVAALGAFDLDPCAGPKSHASVNIRKPDCGLAADWQGRVWMNPPYWRIHDWLTKFAQHGNGICLVNARPETRWFQRLLECADAALWMRGRISFEQPNGKRGHGPVGSVLVAYGRKNAGALLCSGLPGIVTFPCSRNTERSGGDR